MKPASSRVRELRAESLTYRYSAAASTVIDDFSWTFSAGEMTALTGVSGSGKSTLLYLLAGLLTPLKGRIIDSDVVISELPDWRRARFRAAKYGFVFQDAMLDPSRTVLDNVCEAGIISGKTRSDAEEAAWPLLARFGVDHRATHRPGEVSGGQAQRVAMCRALINSPTVLFADEPTGNLDSDSAAIVIRALQEVVSDGACVIIATHSDTVATHCDHVVTLAPTTADHADG